MRLNIGCGKDIKKDWINLDIIKDESIDIVHDLNDLPLPFDNNTFDYILCQDILEHVNFAPLINEIHRILKPKGKLEIRVPHFTSKLNFEDPTHKHQFSIRTFDYFIKNDFFKYRRNINYFSKIEKKILFDKKGLILRFLNFLLESYVNISEKHQNMYESSLLRIFPALNIKIILVK